MSATQVERVIQYQQICWRSIELNDDLDRWWQPLIRFFITACVYILSYYLSWRCGVLHVFLDFGLTALAYVALKRIHFTTPYSILKTYYELMYQYSIDVLREKHSLEIERWLTRYEKGPSIIRTCLGC